MYTRATSLPNLYIRNIIPDGTSIPLAEHLGLSGRGYALIHPSAWNRNSRKFISSISHTRGRTGRKGGREALTWCIQGM
jgi:hypothetical protein